MSRIYKRFYQLKGLCREESLIKIEEDVKKLPFIKSLIINPLNLRLIIEIKENIDNYRLLEKLEEVISKIENDVEISEIINKDSEQDSINKNEEIDSINDDNNSIECEMEKKLTNKLYKSKNVKFFIKKIKFQEISKLKYYWIVASIFLIFYSILFGNNDIYNFLFISFLIIETKSLLTILLNLFKNKELEEKLIIIIGFIVLFVMGYSLEAMAVILVFELNQVFAKNKIDKTKFILSNLANINYNSSYQLESESESRIVDVKIIKNKDIISLKSGDIIPIDGIVVDGFAKIDTSDVSGEYVDTTVKYRDKVLAGWKVQSGSIEVKVSSITNETLISKAVDCFINTIKNTLNIGYTLNLKNKYIILIFVILIILISCTLSLKLINIKFILFKICIILILLVPNHLIVTISIIKSFGVSLAFKKGILFKKGEILDDLNKVGAIVLRKTNVLTYGNKEVSKIISYGYISEDLLLEYATYAELNSNGIISKAIIAAFKKRCPNTIIDKSRVSAFEEFSGMGVKIYLGDRYILVGNRYLMEKYNVEYEKVSEVGTLLYVAVNKNNIGYIIIDDKLKEDSPNAINSLKNFGIKNIVLITGDNDYYSNYLGQVLNIENIHSEVLPENKYNVFMKVRNSLKIGKKLAIVECSNSLKEQKETDVIISFYGNDIKNNIEDSNVFIMSTNPTKISEAFQISNDIARYISKTIGITVIYKIFIMSMFLFANISFWITIISDASAALIILIAVTKKLYDHLTKIS